ncbi:class I tRNA ligase family protein, partial [Candidatus Parcubacteria bacterium]|nr:class I tRNA ligase family protein [Candidatus Parcubacteria bacterium]
MTEQKKQNATKAFYITTTLPYVNAEPHIGHAMEFIRADIIARYKKLMGFDVFFNTGTDEHGLKVFKKSEEEGVDIKNYVDKYAQKFKDLLKLLNISKDIHFVRTTDAHHKSAAQHFWELCDKSGDIYKKNYKIKYCV